MRGSPLKARPGGLGATPPVLPADDKDRSYPLCRQTVTSGTRRDSTCFRKGNSSLSQPSSQTQDRIAPDWPAPTGRRPTTKRAHIREVRYTIQSTTAWTGGHTPPPGRGCGDLCPPQPGPLVLHECGVIAAALPRFDIDAPSPLCEKRKERFSLPDGIGPACAKEWRARGAGRRAPDLPQDSN